tara:strand:- start:89 stop:364 length:276 start_codon:yes stop_codon:yes gene_type:complete
MFLKQLPSFRATKHKELPYLRTDFAHPATLISVSINSSWLYQILATLTLCPYDIGATGLNGIGSFLSISPVTASGPLLAVAVVPAGPDDAA